MSENPIAAEPCGCTLYDDSEPDGEWSIVLCERHVFGNAWAVEAYFRAKHPAVFERGAGEAAASTHDDAHTQEHTQ